MKNSIPSDLRKNNERIVMTLIEEHGPISQKDISELALISLATTGKIINSLLDNERILVCEDKIFTGGRRASAYVLNPKFEYQFLIIVDENNLTYTWINYQSKIEESIKVSLEINYLNNFDNFIRMIQSQFDQSDLRPVKKIKISVPGVVNNGVVREISMLENWEGINIKTRLEREFMIETVVENDVNVALLGYYHNKKLEYLEKRNLVYIFMNKTVGSSIMLNSRLIKGKSNFSGEISSLPIEIDGKYVKLEDYLISKGYNDFNLLSGLLFRLISYYIVFYNPEYIVVDSQYVNKNVITSVENEIRNYFSDIDLPLLVWNVNSSDYTLDGLIELQEEI